MATMTEVIKSAQAEIMANMQTLLDKGPPADEIERAMRLDQWEQVGAAIREYFAGVDLYESKMAALENARRQAQDLLQEERRAQTSNE